MRAKATGIPTRQPPNAPAAAPTIDASVSVGMVGGVKATFIALLAFSFCLPALGAKKKTGVEEDGYKGRVKSVKKSNFNIVEKFGKPVRSSVGLKYTYKYDEKGNQT